MKILSVDDAFETITGYSKDDIRKKQFFQVDLIQMCIRDSLRVCRKGKRNCLLFSFLAVFLLFFGSIIHIRRQNRTAEEQYLSLIHI